MDVRMPDGTVITGVPDGITQTELLRRLNKTRELETSAAPAAPAASEEETGGFGNAFLSGFATPVQAIGRTARALGAETIGGALESVPTPKGYVSAGERLINPKEGDFTVGGLALGYLPRAAVEQVGQLAGSITSRIGGAAIGGALGGPGGAAIGAILGPTGFGGLQVLGDAAFLRAKNNNREKPNYEDLLGAVGTAVSSGFIDAISAKLITGAAGPILKRVASGAASEGGTEFAQSIIEQFGGSAGTEKGLDISGKQAVAEGLIGAITGGGASALLGQRGPQKVDEEGPPSEPVGNVVGDDIVDPRVPVGSAFGLNDDEGNERVITIDSVKDVNGVPYAEFTYHDTKASGSGPVEDLLPSMVKTDVAPLTTAPPEDNAQKPEPFDIQDAGDARGIENKIEANKPKTGTLLGLPETGEVSDYRAAAVDLKKQADRLLKTNAKNITPAIEEQISKLNGLAGFQEQQADKIEKERGASQVNFTEEDKRKSDEAAQVRLQKPPPISGPLGAAATRMEAAGIPTGSPAYEQPVPKVEPIKIEAPPPAPTKPRTIMDTIRDAGGLPPSRETRRLNLHRKFPGVVNTKARSDEDVLIELNAEGYLSTSYKDDEKPDFREMWKLIEQHALSQSDTELAPVYHPADELEGIDYREYQRNLDQEYEEIGKRLSPEAIDLRKSIGISESRVKTLKALLKNNKTLQFMANRDVRTVDEVKAGIEQEVKTVGESVKKDKSKFKKFENTAREKLIADKRAASLARTDEARDVVSVDEDERAAQAALPKQERFVESIKAPEPTEMTIEEQRAEAVRLFAEIAMSSEKKAANDEERSKALEFEKQIEGKTVFKVAKIIAEKSDNPSYRLIASRVLAKLEQLSKAGVEFSFKVLRVGDVVDNRLHDKNLQGAVLSKLAISLEPNKKFDVYVKSVALSPDNFGTSEKITLHELIHAATLSATRQAITGKIGPNTNIGRLFKDLVDVRSQIIDYVKKKITSKEQLTDFEKEIANAENNFLSKGGTGVDEVITYALTDPRAQSFLESIPYKGSNLFSKFIESIRRFLGLSAKSDTALSEVLRISEGFLNADVSEIFPAYKEAKAEQKAKPVQFDLFSELSDPSGAFSISKGQEAEPLLNKDGTEQTAAQVSNTVNKVNRVTGDSPKLPSDTISRPVLFFAMMQGVGRKFPVIAAFQHWLQARSERETALIKEGEKPIERMTQLDYKPRKQIEAVMEFARLTNTNVTPRNGRITVRMPENYNGVIGRPGEVFILDKEQTEIFMGMKQYFKTRWAQKGQAVGKRWGYGGAWDATAIDAAIADAQAQGNSSRAGDLNHVKNIYNALKGVENYVPFSRSGDEGFTVTNSITKEVLYFEMVNTKSAWGSATGSNVKKKEIIKSKFAEIRKKFPDTLKRADNGKPLYELSNDPISESEIKKLDISVIEKLLAATNITNKRDRNSTMNNILDALKGTGMGKTQVNEAIRESLLDQVKKAQLAGFTKESRNIPGYSTNFLQSIIDYNRASASVVAGIEYVKQTEEAYDRTQDSKNVPEEIMEYAKRINNYLDSDEKLIGQIKQYGFWSSLWGSASSALVNLSQTPTITATQIAGWAGIPAAGRTMKLSLNMLRALSFDKRKGISLNPNKIKFNSPEEQVAFMDAFNRGRINPTVTQDLHGTSPDNWQDVSRKVGNEASSKLQKFIWNVFDVGTSAFNGAEQVNRATAWLAAYRESQRPGAIAKFKNMYANDERINLIENQFGLTPANIADFFVNETQFIGGKIDRPEILRGVGGIAFQFKQYPMNYIRILKSNMTSAGPEGKIAGTMMLMALTAFGGLLGLPFADDIVDSYEFIKKNLIGIDPMIEYEMRELLEGMGASPEWAEAAARGPARFLGIDVSKRIGQGQILPDANPIMNIPVFSATVGKIIEAKKRFSSDQPIGGIIALASMGLPKGPSDIARGLLQFPTEGYRTQGGDMKVAEPNIGQRIVKAAGFQPTKFSSIQERDYFARRLKYRTKEAEDMLSTKLSSKLANSISAREKGDSQKADKLMREFVDRYQRAAVDFGNPSVPLDEKVRPPSITSIKNRALLVMHPELVVKNARKLKRPALYDLYNEQED